MPSGLRAKLHAMGVVYPASPAPQRPSGVLVRRSASPVDEALFALDPDALRRIGWSGRVFRPERCAFLDTETTGLSGGAGTVAFLVGIGRIEDEDFVVEQYLMRDYPDETELLSRVAKRLEGCESVCTFNGNSFDLPLLDARFAMCRMRDKQPELDRLDLLPPARRTWKLRIGSCRLSQIEERILGCPRGDDLPGSEVPRRYFDYLKTGDLALLEDIIEHNRRDIVTLAALLRYLCDVYAEPEKETHREDVFSMGRALERQGELGRALRLYRIAAVPPSAGLLPLQRRKGNELSAEAAWHIYLLERKNRNVDGMRDILEKMATRGQRREDVYVELSKLYEHHLKEPRRALRYALLAKRYIPESASEALDKRIKRLKDKTERNTRHGPF